MQQPSSDYSLGGVKETCISVELLNRETELHKENVPLSGSSSLEDVFSPCEMQAVSVRKDTAGPPGDYVRRRGYTDSSLLKLPTEGTGSHHAPFQFDRHALARISTSPTLRRLRMASASQALSFQDCPDTAQLRNQKECTRPLHHVCKSPPQCATASSLSLPSCVHPKLLSAKAESETAIADPESASPTSKQPSQKDPLSNGRPHETPWDSWRASSATLPRRCPCLNPTPQEGVQKRGLPVQRSAERRRSSVVVTLPGLEVFPGDLLVSHSSMDHLPPAALLLSAESKKPRWPFARRGVGKDKQKHASDLENCLSTLKITDRSTYEFYSFKSKSWHEFLKAQQTEQKDINNQLEVKKEAAVWELFTSECTYFLDHLLVLKTGADLPTSWWRALQGRSCLWGSHRDTPETSLITSSSHKAQYSASRKIFRNTLKYLQSNEFLLDVDLWRLFANLEELNKISISFLKTFFETVKEHVSKSDSPMDFSSILLKFFQGDLCQTHQIYCLNYTSAVFYLENLRQREDFCIYLKQWCEQNKECKRLHLRELLVAPLHRLTRYPLLLNNIWKRSTDETEKSLIWSLKEKVERSIWDLEGKVKWLDNFQKFRQLQEVIIWPPIWDRDKRFFVPECLKQSLRENNSENLLSSANRLLLHEGRLTLAESTRLLDVYLFLFDDFLLITKIKRNKKKYGGSDTGFIPVCTSLTPELQSFIREGGFCTVLDQPIPLDRLILKNIDPIHITVFSLRNAFLIQQENRYRQSIAIFLLQAQTETAKKTWMSQIETAIANYTMQQKNKESTAFCFPAESSEI